jgi:hypothetical protein
MSEAMPAWFDFSPYTGQSAGYRQTLTEFAAGPAFRSAAVEELVLEDDFYRRPLRPEDLDFLKFTKPVEAATVSRLGALTAQRALRSLYDLSAAVPPAGADSRRLASFADFASESNRRYAAQLAPFLEAYAFGFLANRRPAGELPDEASRQLADIYVQEYQFWMRLWSELKARRYFREGLRFILIQRWCLGPASRRVFAEVRARGHFDGWPAEVPPRLGPHLFDDEVLQAIAWEEGVQRREHSYWQFYLPTSLARCNLLSALARRSELCFALYGMMYAAQAEWLAFESALAHSCSAELAGLPASMDAAESHVDALLRHFAWAFHHVREHGPVAALQMAQGLAAAALLGERARWDLGEQLKWLSAIDQYCSHAQAISQRIERECPGIDRETFVEPHDMCSTTHVHNDHRLVVIEEGVMQFWGNLGMRLEMNPGDKVLIPEGRLHGSTVLSAECTYHQPIIPDEWLRELIDPAPRFRSRAHAETPATEQASSAL